MARILCPACLRYVRLVPVGAGRFFLDLHYGAPRVLPWSEGGTLTGKDMDGRPVSVKVKNVSVQQSCPAGRNSVLNAFRWEHPGYLDALHLPGVPGVDPRQPPG